MAAVEVEVEVEVAVAVAVAAAVEVEAEVEVEVEVGAEVEVEVEVEVAPREQALRLARWRSSRSCWRSRPCSPLARRSFAATRRFRT